MSGTFSQVVRLRRNALQGVRLVLRGQGTIPAFAQTLATQMLVLVLNVAAGVLTARVLGPVGRGIFTAVTLWPQFIASLALVGLPNALVFYMRSTPALANSFVTAALGLGTVLGVLGSALGVIAIPIAMHRLYAPDVVTFAVSTSAVITIVNLATMLLRPVFVVRGQIGTFNGSAWSVPLLYLAIMLAVWCLLPLTAELAAASQFVAATLVLAWMATRLAKGARLDFTNFWTRLHALASYTSRAASGEVLAALAGNLDRLVLVPLIPADELGLYAVAYSLSRLLMVLQAALVPVALPAMAGRTPDEAKALHDRLFCFTLYSVAGIVVATFLLAKWALRLVYGSAFAPAGILCELLVIDAALGCLSFLMGQLYLTLGRPGFLSFVQVAAFAVTAAALLALVPTFGARGAASAMVLSSGFRFVALICGFPLVLGLRPPNLVPRPHDMRRLLDAFRR